MVTRLYWQMCVNATNCNRLQISMLPTEKSVPNFVTNMATLNMGEVSDHSYDGFVCEERRGFL
ncbi:hypothetical protein J6590_099977, partial [Homalodisca vitripennis]